MKIFFKKCINKRFFCAATSAALLLMVAVFAPIQPARADEEVPAPDAGFEAEHILVQIPDEAAAQELIEALSQADSVMDAGITQEDIDRGFVKIPVAEGADVNEALDELNSLSEETVAQPNFVYYISGTGSTPSDPDLYTQWGLDAVNAYGAWDRVKAEDAGVTVAVIDNGFLTDHEDLADNIVGTYNAVDGGTDVTPVFDDHGTHVAGIISAVADNGVGIAGVSYNADLLPIQVFKASGLRPETTTAEICAAYAYIRENAENYNIRVINLSVGTAVSNPDLVNGDHDKLLFDAIKGAYDDGILTVCAAGSEAGPDKQAGPYYNYPSDFVDCILSVIGVENAEKDGVWPSRMESSNYNMPGQTTKDISAPGGEIYSTSCDPEHLSYISEYSMKDGTSMASPLVAGVAALVFAAAPDLTPGQVSDIICSTAQTLGEDADGDGWNEGYGYGLVNAYKAVLKALGKEEQESTEPVPEPESITTEAEPVYPIQPDTAMSEQEFKAPMTGDKDYLPFVIAAAAAVLSASGAAAYRSGRKKQ